MTAFCSITDNSVSDNMIYDCPYPAASAYYSAWQNYSGKIFDGNRERYCSYLCGYARYQHLKKIAQPIERYLIILFSTFGFFGGLLTVLTLSQKRFRILDFQMYRVIGCFEMIQMAVLAIMDLLAYLRCESSYACTFLWAHIAVVVMNVCADAIDLLVLFLCVERAVACLLPLHFHRLHTRQSYTWAIVFSVIVPAFFSVFQAFELRVVYDEDQGRYYDEPSEFSRSELYILITHMNTARFYIMAALIMINTFFSIWGFYAVIRRRRNLGRDYCNNQQATSRCVIPASPSSNLSTPAATIAMATALSANNSTYTLGGAALGTTTTTISLAEQRQPLTRPVAHNHQRSGNNGGNGVGSSRGRGVKKREIELCCLQLCLAAPIIINHILYATGLNMNYGFVIGESAFRKGLTYGEAQNEIRAVIDFYYLRMATNLTNVLAHALHFYLYLSFSIQVRHGFSLLVRSCKAKFRRSAANGTSDHNLIGMSMMNEMSLA